MIEELEVLDDCCRIEHGVDRRVDLILEREDIPANLPMRVLEHASVEPSEHI